MAASCGIGWPARSAVGETGWRSTSVLRKQHETQRILPQIEVLAAKGMLPEKLAGDKCYSDKWIRAYLLAKGIKPEIPHQKSEAGQNEPFDRAAYRERNLIERRINRLK